jgi:hypothetical protein
MNSVVSPAYGFERLVLFQEHPGTLHAHGCIAYVRSVGQPSIARNRVRC